MSDRAIQEAIQILSGTNLSDKVYAVDATVLSVDDGKRTCQVQVISGKANNTFTARLMSAVDDGFLIIPTIDSTVGVLMSDFTKPLIVQYSEVDKIIMRGGDLGGLVKVISLTDKINTIENKINDLILKYNSHTHNVTAVGSPTGPGLQPESGTITPTLRSDIENDKITHG